MSGAARESTRDPELRDAQACRAVVDAVHPTVDGGRFPIKRTVGEHVDVTAHLLVDGHDTIAGDLLVRVAGETGWRRTPLRHAGNDEWCGRFSIDVLADHHYTVESWIDEVATWHQGVMKKRAAAVDVSVELLVGADLLGQCAARARGQPVASAILEAAAELRAQRAGAFDRITPELLAACRALPDPTRVSRHERELRVDVDRPLARHAAWYELFPRSASRSAGAHGTLKDVAARLPYIKQLGFDVVYLPPIHPIGRTARKGKDNAISAEAGDVGSPWAIGASEGGHDAVHPQLGTIEDLRALTSQARSLGLEVALDLALQCAPDHPWVTAHPEWFKRRPDGSVQYAENPPKKYQDIVPLDFECVDAARLRAEILRVVLHWVAHGVTVFRVDNPHTKPFAFWEWLIGEVRARHPEVFFLSEAFTRPKVMYRLAKLGFAQSYNYFPWRNTKHELTTYLTEVTRPPVSEFFRPCLWPSTPDILPESLQVGGAARRPAFIQRLVLAATLGASYGIYGPAFELLEDEARAPGTEDFARSEKYEIRHWDLEAAHSIRAVVERVNQIRRAHDALRSNDTLQFLPIDNDQLLAFAKTGSDGALIVVIVNLDPHHTQSGHLELRLDEGAMQAHDLLSGARYFWSGARHYISIDPAVMPAHVMRIRRKARTEHDFDYYL